jgi:hypothetical protein
MAFNVSHNREEKCACVREPGSRNMNRTAGVKHTKLKFTLVIHTAF